MKAGRPGFLSRLRAAVLLAVSLAVAIGAGGRPAAAGPYEVPIYHFRAADYQGFLI